jgi:hypothetical protein
VQEVREAEMSLRALVSESRAAEPTFAQMAKDVGCAEAMTPFRGVAQIRSPWVILLRFQCHEV